MSTLTKSAVIYLFGFLLLSVSAASEWSFLDVDRIGAKTFIQKNPQYNGQDVVIIILDTGIDMAVPGLTQLPDGRIKVIDVQDFSGEGDVRLQKAEMGMENDQPYLKTAKGYKLFGYDKISYQPIDSIYYIGVLDEKDFVNSAIPDINNNNKQNDQFAVIAFESTEGWVAFVDLDGDSNIDDEQALWNYKDKQQSFQFRGRDTQKGRNLANFALNIFSDEKRVNFHFDGNGHGTHVAGIAAGYEIAGQAGLNGVAPGAQLISLKIGNGQLSGGATITGSMIKAFEYGAEFAKTYNGAVVFNLSYGIGSEIEGLADMDLMLDHILEENPALVICSSAGNEGPGISTVGLPAAAKRIMTVGAIYTPAFARDVYGAKITRDVITRFSSRGGEINKPDVLTPGAAMSTIPPYSSSEVKGGTSMASPQAAGAVALIMSAALQQQPALAVIGALIKRAIKNAAEPLPGYAPIEQGSGVINVPVAWEYYKKYATDQDYTQLLDYDIRTISPRYESGFGQTAYWRFGTYVPGADDPQIFYINPFFTDELDADERNQFYRAYNLVSTEPWIKPGKNSTYVKGDKSATVEVFFDRDKIRQPGIYSGKVNAYRKAGFASGNKAIDKEFELLCTIVQPLTFDGSQNRQWQSPQLQLGTGEFHRIYYKIPSMASSGLIRLKALPGKYADVRAYLFDPDGRRTDGFMRLNTESGNETSLHLSTDKLEPGTWELVLYGDIGNVRRSSLQMDITFSALQIIPEEINFVRISNGSDPGGSFQVINHYDRKVAARVGGSLQGIEQKHVVSASSDHYEYPFTVSDLYEQIEFEIELEPQVYNLFTDFAINIKDYSGKSLLADGLNYRKHKITWRPPAAGDYILEFIPGFARKVPQSWQLNMVERYYFTRKASITGSRDDYYPGLKKEVEFSINGTLMVAPDGYHLFGEIWLDETGKERFRNTVPLKLHTGINN